VDCRKGVRGRPGWMMCLALPQNAVLMQFSLRYAAIRGS